MEPGTLQASLPRARELLRTQSTQVPHSSPDGCHDAADPNNSDSSRLKWTWFLSVSPLSSTEQQWWNWSDTYVNLRRTPWSCGFLLWGVRTKGIRRKSTLSTDFSFLFPISWVVYCIGVSKWSVSMANCFLIHGILAVLFVLSALNLFTFPPLHREIH